MLIKRYLAKEIMLTLLATLLVLLGILFSQRLAMYLSEAANGALASDAILGLLSLQMLKFSAELLPLGFLIASLMAFGRLYRDSEMTAMFALGVSPNTLYKSLLWIAIPSSLILLLLNVYVVPKSANLQYELQVKARNEARLNVFKAGVFKEISGGIHVVYVEKITNEGTALQNVFLRTIELGKISITTAVRGNQTIDLKTGMRFLHLYDGSRYEVDVAKGFDKKTESVLRFDVMDVKMDQVSVVNNQRSDSISTKLLLESDTLLASAELQRRLAGPISILLLVLLIPSLAHAKPRESKYNRLILGVIIYVIYFNLLGIANAWIQKEYVSSILGLWWVHVLMLIKGIIFRHLQNRRL